MQCSSATPHTLRPVSVTPWSRRPPGRASHSCGLSTLHTGAGQGGVRAGPGSGTHLLMAISCR